MAVEEHHRWDMARQQLETALRLFFKGDDFYSVITLAGAAELVLARALESVGRQPNMTAIAGIVAAVDPSADQKGFIPYANTARDSLKHWEWEKQPLTLAFDAHEEATDMLDRAVTNYLALTRDLTPLMARYMKEKLAGRQSS